jgi:hypothetical protein
MVFLYEGGFSMIVISFRMCCDERRLAFVWTANCGRYIYLRLLAVLLVASLTY